MKPARLLRGNGNYSLASGVTAIGAGPFASPALGLAAWVPIVIGTGLVIYGLGLRSAARGAALPAAVRFATVMDCLWLIGALVILLAFPDSLSGAGRILLGAVSIPVAGFAIGQTVALLGPMQTTGASPS